MADENSTGIRPAQPPVHDKPPGYLGDFGEKIGGAGENAGHRKSLATRMGQKQAPGRG